jgi:DNA-binding transcriptional regulator YdaS (Cro superfamily)
MDTNALLKAIKVKGSQASLAKSIGVTQQTISNWLTKSKVGVAPEYVLPIERETGVSRHELRPDIYPLPESLDARAEGVRA